MDSFFSKLAGAEGIKVSLWIAAYSHLLIGLHTDLEDPVAQREEQCFSGRCLYNLWYAQSLSFWIQDYGLLEERRNIS